MLIHSIKDRKSTSSNATRPYISPHMLKVGFVFCCQNYLAALRFALFDLKTQLFFCDCHLWDALPLSRIETSEGCNCRFQKETLHTRWGPRKKNRYTGSANPPPPRDRGLFSQGPVNGGGCVLQIWGGGVCTRVKWVPFVLLAFFPCFIVFFASKLAIFPLKFGVLGAWKGHIRA